MLSAKLFQGFQAQSSDREIRLRKEERFIAAKAHVKEYSVPVVWPRYRARFFAFVPDGVWFP